MGTNIQSLIVSSEEGPVWNMEPGRPTTFKLLSEQTQESVAVFEEVVPAGGGTPLHIHRTSDELIYVLSGEFTFKIEDHLSKHGPGTWVFIQRGIPHAWKNSGTESGRAFFVFTPAEGAKCFEELRKFDLPIQAIDMTAFHAICERYGYEMVGPWL